MSLYARKLVITVNENITSESKNNRQKYVTICTQTCNDSKRYQANVDERMF